jgi:alpha-N-arabinofuranosidase
MAPNPSGDERYFNNIFVTYGLVEYDRATLPVFMNGNVFLDGARPSKHEANVIINAGADPGIQLIEKDDGMYLRMVIDESWMKGERQLVTTQLLGKAHTPQLPFEMPDGSPYIIGEDFLGEDRDAAKPGPGPFEFTKDGDQVFKVR